MEQRLEPLFTPWKIGNCEIKNRIVLTSMGGTNLLGWMEVNHFDKDGARFIMEVAKNNCGLVLPGCQPVYNPMYGKWLYKNEKMYQDLAKWMPEFHKTGAKLFVQLTAGFGRSFTISSMMETLYTNKALRVLAKPVMDLDKITAAPSPSPNRWSDKVPSREMTVEEIEEFITAFGKTAKLLKDAVICLDGFTGFTPVQYQLIEELMRVCSDIYVTVTMDESQELFQPGEKHELFYLSKKTTAHFLYMIKDNGMEEPEVIRVGEEIEKTRFHDSEQLGHLERSLFRFPVKAYHQGAVEGDDREEAGIYHAVLHRCIYRNLRSDRGCTV